MLALRTIALAAAALLAGCAAGPDAAERNLVVAFEARDLPPLHSKGGDSFIGFEPDLVNALCEAMQMRCAFVDVPFHRILPGLVDGRFDAALPLESTESRAKVVDFTDPYLRFPYSFLKKKGSGFTTAPQTVSGSTIGVLRFCPDADDIKANSSATAYLTTRFEGVRTKPYDMLARCDTAGSISAADIQDWLPRQLQDLNAGTIDAIFGNKLALHEAVVMAPGGRRFEFTDATYFDFAPGMTMAVSRTKPDLAHDLNAALKAIKQDGTYDEIRKRYFPFDMSGPA